VKYVRGGPAKPGAIEVAADKSFRLSGDVADGEIRASIWRNMAGVDPNATGANVKSYEIQFRYQGANNYHALQMRSDGYYRIIKVAGGKTTTLVGTSSGGYLPLPGWDRDNEYDDVLLVFRGTHVTGTFNGKRLSSSSEAGEGAGKVAIRSVNGMNMGIEKLSVDE
jgi:hypothetical protein